MFTNFNIPFAFLFVASRGEWGLRSSGTVEFLEFVDSGAKTAGCDIGGTLHQIALWMKQMAFERTLPYHLITLIAVTAALIGIGLTGIARGDELEGGAFVSRQLVWIVLGAAAGTIAYNIPYQRFRMISVPLYLLVIILLIAVFAFPPKNGARRWIPLGAFTIQPSELAKIAVILALGHYLMFRKNHRTLVGLIPPFVMTTIPVLLILKEPDLGSAMLFFPVMYSMLFIAGARRSHLVASVVIGLMLVPVLWSVMSAEQKSRVTAVFHQTDGGKPETGDGYHLYQSKQLLALGGVWGSKLQPSQVQDFAAWKLPASRTDFIICLIGESLGIPGTVLAFTLYSVFVFAGLGVAAKTRDPFGRLLATGIVVIVMTQVAVNTSMTVGLSPITGLTLPLLSYGGSSFVTTSFCLGMLFNIARSPGFDLTGQPFEFSEGSRRHVEGVIQRF